MRVVKYIVFVFFFSCSENKHELPPYYQELKREANIRGVQIYSIPKVILSQNLKERYDAYWDGHAIYIDTTSNIWKKFPEETMFHEYGHAILNRSHTFDRLPNGMYKSVMGNYSNIQYGGWSAHDSIYYRREYYLDELFNQKTDVPEWAR